jgi:hypothetical protein
MHLKLSYYLTPWRWSKYVFEILLARGSAPTVAETSLRSELSSVIFLHISYDPRVDYCNTRTVLHY